jgi:hypothetical protein
MKRFLFALVVLLIVLFLTKLANDVTPEQKEGISFSLKGQQVVACSATEIVLVNTRKESTHLDKDESWPECSEFTKDDVYDFYLSRGDRTHFLSYEKTVWWRKVVK